MSTILAIIVLASFGLAIFTGVADNTKSSTFKAANLATTIASLVLAIHLLA